jgi:putative redox protein
MISMDEGILSATAIINTDTYKTELTARTHKLIGDEPVDVGGKDLGPRPGDFLRMSLASCTAITLRMYSNRKNMDVKQIEVTVSNGPTTDKTVYQTDIKITGNISDEDRERLIQIAKKCPVHKILTNPIQVEHTLKMKD